MRLVEAAGVELFRFTDSTELIENLGTHKTQNLLKWAGHYTRITRGRPEQCPNINGDYQDSTPPGITCYLENNILGTSLLYLHDLDTDPAPMQCP
jgi:hypothetical protein